MLESTLKALAALRASEAMPLGQGLSAENAAACLHQAIRPFNPKTLAEAVEAAGPVPERIAIIVPAGVFTTPIEWVAIAVAAGAIVHLKAPSIDPALCRRLTACFTAEGLPVTCGDDRELPPVDAILAFGGDSTIDDIVSDYPDVPVVRYGHRFSLAFVGGDPEAAAGPLALDVARYDSRGCMAPTAVFTTADPDLLVSALIPIMQQMEQRTPRGEVAQAFGPEWRRRLGLARVLGTATTGAGWAITVTPAEQYVPEAMPRMINIHPVDDADHLRRILAPRTHQLSTLGTDDPTLSLPGIHRVCALGWMQAPTIPRKHDGRAMLADLKGGSGGT